MRRNNFCFPCFLFLYLDIFCVCVAQQNSRRTLLQSGKKSALEVANFSDQRDVISSETQFQDDFDEQLVPAREDEQEKRFQGGGKVIQLDYDRDYFIDNDTDLLSLARLILPSDIFGVQDDLRRKVNNTEQTPFNAVGMVGSHCTGTAIGPYHVLTAAHCIYDRYSESFYPNTHFTPGQNGYDTPYKTYSWTFAFIPDEFLAGNQSIKNQNDYALIILNEKLEQDIIPLEFGNSCNQQQQQFSFNLPGYPSDKEPNTMYTSACVDIEYQCEWKIFGHTCDTFNGMSGGSMFIAYRKPDDSVGYSIRALHIGGNLNLILNEALIITEQVESQLRTWINQFQIIETPNA